MISSKVILTYKRKRFSTQAHLVHGIKEANSSPDSLRGASSKRLHPKAESGCYNEKLHKDSVNISQNELQYSTSTQRQDFEESTQDQVQEKKRTRRNESIGTSETGPMKLRSQKVLLSRKLVEDDYTKANPSATDAFVRKTADSSLVDFSCNSLGSACKLTCVEGTSRSKTSDLGDLRLSPMCLNSSTERKYGSENSDSILRTLSSDNVLLNKENPKVNSSPPLITFSRRIKKKQIISATPVENKLKAEDNQCSSAYWSSRTLEASCEHENSSQKCSFKDQLTAATVPLEQAGSSALHMLRHDVMVNADKDATPDSAPAGGFLEAKTAGGTCEGSSFSHAGLNSDFVEYDHVEPSNKCMTLPSVDGLGDSILLMRELGPSDLVKVGTNVREESGNNLAIANSDKMILSQDISEKCQISYLNVSIAPLSAACPSNGESNKPSADVVPENLLESQSSNPSCIEVLDDEADGRGKELEWLESLDRALQDAKKNKNASPFRDQGDVNCVQTSSSRASPTFPSNATVQIDCNQGESGECMNQVSPLQERIFLTGSGRHGDDKQQHEEASRRPSLSTNFLGLSLPLNSRMPIGSVKDFQSMPSSSSLGFKEAGRMYNGRLPWHKQIVEDVITSTRMLKEMHGSFLDKFKRYSSEWSEEELDSLWIGVRRHGIHNWSAMLRDSKLQFSESRVAEDLAKRWDLEQRRLLNSSQVQPASLSRPVLSSSSVMDNTSLAKPAAAAHYGSYGAPTETKLSLGDVYLQKENNLKRNPFRSFGLVATNLLGSSSSSTASFLGSFPTGPSYSMAGIRHQKLARPPSTRYDWEILGQKSGDSSIKEHQPAGLSPSSDLPHWLREVLDTPPGIRESVLNTVSTVAQPLNLPVDPPAPPKDSRSRGILKRKSRALGNSIEALRVSDVPTPTNEPWIGTRLCSLQSLSLVSQKPASGVTGPDQYRICDLNKKNSGACGPRDLVVIESDASSEETISDAEV